MTARSRMTHRALVERNSATGADSDGYPNTPSWTTHIAALPCYFWSQYKTEAIDESKAAVVEATRMAVPSGTDINQRDRVRDIKDRTGAVYAAGVFVIEGIQERATHREISLRSVDR